MSVSRDKRRTFIFIFLCIAVSVVLLFTVGRPMVNFVSDPVRFRAWVVRGGFGARIAFLSMMLFQVLVAIIPGEPLEIAAGYAFGVWEGTLLCLIAIAVGTALIFLFVRKFGMRLITVFFSKEKIDSLSILHDPKKVYGLSFLLFFIPGTPKDLLTYFLGLTVATLPNVVLISTVARIPSVLTSTLGGSVLGDRQFLTAALVFAGTALLSLAGLLLYKKITAVRSNR